MGSRDEPLRSVRVPGWDTEYSLEENEDDSDSEKVHCDFDALEYEDDDASEEEAPNLK